MVSEGAVLPELKMAADGAAPRRFTSGFGAAGPARLTFSASLRNWRKAKRRPWKRPGWEAALRAGAASTPRRPAADWAAFVQVKTSTLVCIPPFIPASLSLGVDKEIRPLLPRHSSCAVTFWWPGTVTTSPCAASTVDLSRSRSC